MNSSSPRNRNSKIEFTRLKQVLSNLEKMQKTIEVSSQSQKLNPLSLKILSSQLNQAYSPRRPKKQLKKPKTFSKPVAVDSLEFASQVLEDNDPKEKKFITESMMQSRPIYTVLQKQKRQFGPIKAHSPELQLDSYPIVRNALSSKAVRKRLDAILYNNVYKNSQRSKRFQIIKHFEEMVQEPRLFGFKTERASPVLLQKFRESEKIQIAKEFRNLVSQEELEIDLIKLRLNRDMFRDPYV